MRIPELAAKAFILLCCIAAGVAYGGLINLLIFLPLTGDFASGGGMLTQFFFILLSLPAFFIGMFTANKVGSFLDRNFYIT